MNRTRIALLATLVMIITFAIPALADKPLTDYSFIRGVCYPNGWRGDEATVRRDLGYAQRLQLNSTRIWLSTRSYQQNPEDFINRLRTYVRIAHSMGISTMPILFNGGSLNSTTLDPSAWPQQEEYVKAVVDALKKEPGLLMWDIMNEPSWNDYYNQATGESKTKFETDMKAYLSHFVKYVKSLDPVNATTIGHTFPKDIEWCLDVDVFSFHDYLQTRQMVENSYTEAEALSKKYKKPIINTELSCVCRANPYDMSLEICERHNVGWYVFELMIGGSWSDVHGLVYPDGTVRDPSIIAAIYGFYRNRDLKTAIRENPNREGHAQKALDQLKTALAGSGGGHRGGVGQDNTDAILEAAEYCANLLEAAQMVPMHVPPTAKIQQWRSQPPAERDQAAIRAFALELGRTLEEWCGLI
jgi:hypothetical protein